MENFCKECNCWLVEVTTGIELKTRCGQCGILYDATPEQTLRASEEINTLNSEAKHRSTIGTTAFDPINPREKKTCKQCKNAVMSYQRIGESRRPVYVCECGHKES